MPTDKDIEDGKAAVAEALEKALRGQMLILQASRFKVFEGATLFSLLKEDVITERGNEGTFGIFSEAEMQQLVFDEEMLKEALIEKAKQAFLNNEIMDVRDFTITYGEPSISLRDGKIDFSVTGSIVFTRAFDEVEFQKQILGQDEATLKRLIIGIPGLEEVNVSLWPFWVKHVPANPQKVTILLE